MIFTATTAGTVGTIATKQNDYVQPGEDLATIDRSGSLFVQADFVLTPREYEQLKKGESADIVLPDRTTLRGTVRSIQVKTINGQAHTQVHLASGQLEEGAYNGLVVPGAPVQATVHLEQQGVLASMQNSSFDFLRRIGL